LEFLILNPRREIDVLGPLTHDCLMRSTFSSDVPGRPEDFCFSTILSFSLQPPIQNIVIWGSSPGCKLRYLRCTVKPISILHIIKKTQLSVSRSTLAGLGNSYGRPCAQVISIGQQAKVYQRRSLLVIS
jgi:hypothetical protein